MKREIILILILVVFSSSALAVNVEIKAEQNHVIEGQNATFLVTIDNDAFEHKLFTIRSVDLNWMLEETIVDKLSNKEKKSYILTFTPLKDLKPNIYGVSLIITSDKGDRIERFIEVNLLHKDKILEMEIVPFRGVINPREKNTVSFRVKNKYEIPFDSLKVELKSDFLSKEFEFPLGKKEEHVEDFILEVDENLESGNYNVNTVVIYDNEILTEQSINVKVEYISDLTEITDIKKGVLTAREIVKKINNGNSLVKEKYTREFSISEKTFTIMNPKPDKISKTDGRYELTWELEVGPGEEKQIILNKNYRDPLIILVIILLIGYFVYKWKVKAIKVKKKVMTIHIDKDLISDMKVLISIKNRSNRNIKKIKIRERIPDLDKGPKDFGSLSPDSVKKFGKDMILSWEIDKLRVGEERLLSYRVSNKLHMIGKLVLPPTIVKFEDKNKIKITYSNKVNISRKQ